MIKSQRSNPTRTILLSGLACAALATFGPATMAQAVEWANNGNDWGTGANWVGGSVPGAAGTGSGTTAIAEFPSIGTAVHPDLAGDFSIGALDINNSGDDYNITQTGSRTLRMNGATVDSVANTYFRITGGGTTNIAPAISMPGGGGGTRTYVFELGGATLNLDGLVTNTHNGPRLHVVNGGTLNFNGGVEVDPGSSSQVRDFIVDGTGDVLLNGLTWTIASKSGGAHRVVTAETYTGTMTLGGTITVRPSNNIAVNEGVIHQGGTLALRNGLVLTNPDGAAGTISWHANADTVLRADGGPVVVNHLTRLRSSGASQAFLSPTIAGSDDLTFADGFRFETEGSANQVLFITNTGKTTFAGSEFWIGNTGSPARNVELNVAAGSVAEISSQIRKGNPSDQDGDASLTLSGGGILELSNSNNIYGGTTTVAGGTLLVTGTLASGGGAVTVNSGATLGGDGTINRDVIIQTGGFVAPGNDIGILETLNFTGQTGATARFEFGPGSSGDQISVLSNLTLNDGFIIDLSDFGGADDGDYTLFTFGGSFTGNVDNINVTSDDGSVISWGDLELSDDNGGELILRNLVFFQDTTGPGDPSGVIPEPASALLLLTGVAGLALRRRRLQTHA